MENKKEKRDDGRKSDQLIALKRMNKLIKDNDNIILDTCAAMSYSFPHFVAYAIPMLKKNNKKITVLRSVYLELKRHMTVSSASQNDVDKALRINSNAMSSMLSSLDALDNDSRVPQSISGDASVDSITADEYQKKLLVHMDGIGKFMSSRVAIYCASLLSSQGVLEFADFNSLVPIAKRTDTDNLHADIEIHGICEYFASKQKHTLVITYDAGLRNRMRSIGTDSEGKCLVTVARIDQYSSGRDGTLVRYDER